MEKRRHKSGLLLYCTKSVSWLASTVIYSRDIFLVPNYVNAVCWDNPRLSGCGEAARDFGESKVGAPFALLQTSKHKRNDILRYPISFTHIDPIYTIPSHCHSCRHSFTHALYHPYFTHSFTHAADRPPPTPSTTAVVFFPRADEAKPNFFSLNEYPTTTCLSRLPPSLPSWLLPRRSW